MKFGYQVAHSAGLSDRGAAIRQRQVRHGPQGSWPVIGTDPVLARQPWQYCRADSERRQFESFALGPCIGRTIVPGDEHDRRIAGGRCATAFQKKLAARPHVELSSKIELSIWCFGKHLTTHRNERRKSEECVRQRKVLRS